MKLSNLKVRIVGGILAAGLTAVLLAVMAVDSSQVHPDDSAPAAVSAAASPSHG